MYIIKCTNESPYILNSKKPNNGILAFLNAKKYIHKYLVQKHSYTERIEIHHDPHYKIRANIKRKILFTIQVLICNNYCIIYSEIESISMGSPLGPTLSNF